MTDKKSDVTAQDKDKAVKESSAKKEASTKKTSAGKKPEKISASKKTAANNAIKSKVKTSGDSLKERAAQAKKRAQEKILEKSYVSDPPDDPLERLANTFDNSARRWEMVVYPSLFAFVLLAGYGFFLIYRLTHDISSLSQSVTRMAVIVSDVMPRMAKDLNGMTGSMDNMSGDIDGMTTEIGSMSTQMDSLTPMSNNIQSMTHNIGSMNRSVYGMQRDMHGMNRTVSSGPFGMMNDMMPFKSNTNIPPPMPAPRVWPTYNSAAKQQFPVPVKRPPAKSSSAKKLPASQAHKKKGLNQVSKKQQPPVMKKKQAAKLVPKKNTKTKATLNTPVTKDK